MYLSTMNLFAEKPLLLPMPNAEVWYYPTFFTEFEADRYFAELNRQCPWKEEDIVLFGKKVKQPRLLSWHAEPGIALRYSGSAYAPNPFIPPLQAIREQAEVVSGTGFNGVLANLYRNGADSMGLHSDDERELGPDPVIASFSFGAARKFRFKHKFSTELKPVSITLQHGSLLLMKGTTQHFWKHELPKTSLSIGPRINLTYRKISMLP